ncbi:hypothetical protein [Lysinibacillus sp. BW-2-10]|nr:hypothetical protein [Lysinibacillus sp. BW-2-10]
MKNRLETSITVTCLIASVIGMGYIGMAAWQYVSTHYDEAIQLFIRLL